MHHNKIVWEAGRWTIKAECLLIGATDCRRELEEIRCFCRNWVVFNVRRHSLSYLPFLSSSTERVNDDYPETYVFKHVRLMIAPRRWSLCESSLIPFHGRDDDDGDDSMNTFVSWNDGKCDAETTWTTTEEKSSIFHHYQQCLSSLLRECDFWTNFIPVPVCSLYLFSLYLLNINIFIFEQHILHGSLNVMELW